MDPGLARTFPRSTSSLSTPRSRHPTLSPACPSSNSFRKISTPVPTGLVVSPNPTISPSTPPLTPPPHAPHDPCVLDQQPVRGPGLLHNRPVSAALTPELADLLRRPRAHVLRAGREAGPFNAGVGQLLRVLLHERRPDRDPPLPVRRR